MIDDDAPGHDPAAQLPPEFDGFEVVQPLGRGGMGTVYLGRDTMLDRPVALKFIASTAPTPRARERFLLEARALARLQHPNVVGIYRIGNIEGHPYVAYELVAGRALHQVERPVPWRLALSIALSAARGLAAVHRQGILHRDIKPANMILLDNGEVKLLDFGLAKLIDDAAPAPPPAAVATDFAPTEPGEAVPDGRRPIAPRPSDLGPGGAGAIDGVAMPSSGNDNLAFQLTSAGGLAGTPAYMAPELWRGEPATARTDIYALGLVLYELLTGRLPWAPGERERSAQVLGRDVPSVIPQRADVPRPLLEAVDRMTRRDERDRFASSEEMCGLLEEINATYQPFTDAPRGDAHRDEQMLHESFTRIAGDADGFARSFYANVFERQPELRSLFPADMTEQRRKLVTTLQLIVRNAQRAEVVVPMLLDLGARHAHYGTRTEHFATIGDALLASLAKADAGAWNAELERIWSVAYQRLASTMITALEQQLALGSAPSTPAAWTPPVVAPRVHYARNGQLSLAYQLTGSGPQCLVMVPGWVSHLEVAWQEPSYRRFLSRLSSRTRLLLLDKRGTGLSDRTTNSLSLEARADDVLAVMDAAGIERAALFGIADSAPVCALIAATAPERVQALILYDASHPGEAASAAKRSVEWIEAACAEIRKDWGNALFLDDYAPSRADDIGFAGWWAGFLRTSASPAAAEALLRASAHVDVRGALPLISAPALVLHRGQEANAAVTALTAAIPNASSAALPGIDRLPFTEHGDEVVDQILDFLLDLPTEIGTRGTASRRLAAIVTLAPAGAEVTSPTRAEESYHREVVRYGGRVAAQGAAFSAIFSRVGDAVRCGVACLRLARAAGEVLGVSVDVAAVGAGVMPEVALFEQLAAQAAQQADEIVISSEALVLLAGQDITLSPQ